MAKLTEMQKLQAEVDKLGTEISSLKITAGDLAKRVVKLEIWGVETWADVDTKLLVKKKQKQKKKQLPKKKRQKQGM